MRPATGRCGGPRYCPAGADGRALPPGSRPPRRRQRGNAGCAYSSSRRSPPSWPCSRRPPRPGCRKRRARASSRWRTGCRPTASTRSRRTAAATCGSRPAMAWPASTAWASASGAPSRVCATTSCGRCTSTRTIASGSARARRASRCSTPIAGASAGSIARRRAWVPTRSGQSPPRVTARSGSGPPTPACTGSPAAACSASCPCPAMRAACPMRASASSRSRPTAASGSAPAAAWRATRKAGSSGFPPLRSARHWSTA